MKLEIEINEKRITELVELEIAKRIVTKYSGEYSDWRRESYQRVHLR